MATDWFRKTTWSKEDEEDFEARLKRCRTIHNKSQYLRIQASYLARTIPPLPAVALILLERVLTEFRDDAQVSIALLQKAQCLLALEGFEAALPFYREALDFEALHPRWLTNTRIEFPWQIAKEGRRDLYDEALQVLDRKGASLLFQIDRYRSNLVRALVAKDRGEHERAQAFAREAQAAAEIDFSGFRYHKDVGLVRGQEKWALAALSELIGGKP